MAESKLKYKITVNKSEVMDDLDEIKAELSEIDALVDRITEKLRLMAGLSEKGE